MISIENNIDRINIAIKGEFIGQDLLVIVQGGDTPHIGSLSGINKKEDLKTLSFHEHKEYILTEMICNKYKNKINGNLVVCGGIHLDNITKDEIKLVVDMVDKLTEELMKKLKVF